MAAAGPSPFANLIGRGPELALIRHSLLGNETRLLTLTGLAGVGKSHLAVAATDDLRPSFPGGAHVIPMRHVRDVALMLPTIGRALGLPDYAEVNLAETICARVGNVPTLVTLDNLEYVAEAGPELLHLLERCPLLKILVTSRSPLHLPQEAVVPIPPLPVPVAGRQTSVAELRQNEAVSLLVRRAQEIDSEFTLTESNAADVAEICVHLDGLPLAIELAARRLRLLSPAALKKRLSEALIILSSGDPHIPHDHRSLRAAIAASVELMETCTRKLFRRIAVFDGGCDVAAVEAVSVEGEAAAGRSGEVLDEIADLLELGLLHRTVVADDPRFLMPETICAFALEQLEAAGEWERIHHRHAAYFTNMAEEAAPSLVGAHHRLWFSRLTTEYENFGAALRWSLVNEPTLALRITAALWRFWYARGFLREGARWLDRALAATARDKTVHRVRALNGLGVLVWTAGDAERSLRLQEESLALAEELGDAWGIAVAQADFALVEFELFADPERLRSKTERALAAFRSHGDRHLQAIALVTLGDVALIADDHAAAARHFEDALALSREIGDGSTQALCLFNLARSARLTGNLERAETYHLESMALSNRIGGQEDLLYNLAGLGGLAADRNHMERAAELLGAAARLAEVTGIVLQPAEQEQFDRDLVRVKSALPAAAFAQAWNRGQVQSSDGVFAIATMSVPPTTGTTSHGLSLREIEVLRLLANGHSDREIAEMLYISGDTASTHVKNIRRKLGVHTRAAAAAFAIRHNLI